MLILFNSFLKTIDKKYGETIPKASINQKINYDRNIFNVRSENTTLRIDANYTGINKEQKGLELFEKSIVTNWEPYLKEKNTIVVTLDFSNPVVTPEITGNDSCYTAAKRGLDAVTRAYKEHSARLENLNLKNAKLVYKFTAHP